MEDTVWSETLRPRGEPLAGRGTITVIHSALIPISLRGFFLQSHFLKDDLLLSAGKTRKNTKKQGKTGKNRTI